jgi:hypothetical protein
MKIKIFNNYILVLLIFFVLIFFLKYNIFIDHALSIDQAFYNKWLIDLYSVEKFFPSGNDTFINNLYLDRASFLHQFLIRLYNNFSTIFVIFPLMIHYSLNLFTHNFSTNFNTISILVSSLFPFLFLLSTKDNQIKLDYKLTLVFILFVSLVTFNFSFFYYSPLGFHNLGILFNALTIYFSSKNINQKYFFTKNFLLLGYVVPILCHSYNFFFVNLYLLLIVIYRFFFLKKLKIKKDLFIIFLISIFFCFCLFIIFFINTDNIKFAHILISPKFDESFTIFNIFNYIYTNSYLWLLRIKDYFGIVNILIVLLIFFKLRKVELLIAIFAHYLLFTILNLNGFYYSIILYTLTPLYFYILHYLIFLRKTFKVNFYFNLVIIFLIVVSIITNIRNIVYKDSINDSQRSFYSFYYSGQNTIKQNFDIIHTITKNNNIIFNNYLSQDMYYSKYYSFNNQSNYIIKNDIIIDRYYEYLSKNIQSNNLKKIKFFEKKYNMSKIENTFYLYFNYIDENPLTKVCLILESINTDCSKISKVNLPKFVEQFNFMNQNYSMILYIIN